LNLQNLYVIFFTFSLIYGHYTTESQMHQSCDMLSGMDKTISFSELPGAEKLCESFRFGSDYILNKSAVFAAPADYGADFFR